MDIGSLAIITSFIATVISLLGYYMSVTKENEINKKKKNRKSDKPGFFQDLGRLGYYVMTIGVIVASVYLYYLLFTHQYQIKYVYQYTSNDLSLGLLFSTFWAGQEGSFLFWTLLTAVFGLFFLKTAGKYEIKSMVFLNIIMALFLVILIKASPFETIARAPVDGAGLNPLLQNFWMIIHPPILFIGYAAITFPFVLGLSAMWRKDYDGWLNKAIPWTAFSSLTLGAGIILGAFWAYETLGWGGYWGWDPVENSSLIPWLTILALLHGLIVQKRTGSLKKTNFFLAIISFVLVLYATFLTRSGVLQDFSVHSFADLGLYSYLILFMSTALVLGLLFLILRFSDIPVQAINFDSLNRENGLFASMILFLAAGFLTIIGTSSPIITGILGNPSQVDISFYDKVNLPIGALMALLLGVTPLLLWVENDLKSLPRRLMIPILLAVISTIITVMFGVLEIGEIIFICSGYFALWANVIVLYKKWKVSWKNIAGPLSHFGVGIVFVAIIIAGNYDQSERIILQQGQTQTVLDHQLTYKGFVPKEDGKNIVEIQIKKDGMDYLAGPRMYLTKSREMMREPDVKSGIISDIYLSPLERRTSDHQHGSTLTLTKGETKEIQGYRVNFTEFNMTPHEDGRNFQVGAVLHIVKGDFHQTVTPFILIGSDGRHSQPATIQTESEQGPEVSVTLNNLNADEKMIELVFNGLDETEPVDHDHTEQVMVEFSKKPFMSILWLGTVILIIGTFVSFIQRIQSISS
jgi:cytochrome c-type biogenesis protein CcmF